MLADSAESKDGSATRPDSSPTLTVVIATLNGERVLPNQLEALCAQRLAGSFEVIVADNGSTDSTVQVARSFAGRLDLAVLDASSRPGQAFARNLAASRARSDLLIFLDQDDEVSPDYLHAMARALESAAFVAARMDVVALNPGWVSQARAVAQTSQLMGPIPSAYGCTLGVRKPVFDAVGGFDSSLRYASEDVDLCMRLHDRGVALHFVDDAVLRYRFPDTFRALFRQGRRYGAARVALERKQPALSSVTPARWLRGTIGATRMALFGKNRGARARGTFLLGRRVGELQGRATPAASGGPGASAAKVATRRGEHRAPLATVIVPVHNGAATLGEQLAALASQVDAPEFEVVVVLNRSADSSREVASGWTSQLDLSIVDADAKQSASYARNVGASSSNGRCLLFCDDDDRVDERWVAEMLIPLVAGTADVVGGCPVVDRYGLSASMYDRFYASFDDRVLIEMLAKLYPLGASLGCTRSMFEAVGGYDERFSGAGSEEIDLTFRMLRNGARIGIAPEAKFVYRPVVSWREQFRRQRAFARGAALLKAKEGDIPPVPSYREQTRRMTRQVARMAVREREWRPAPYVMKVAAECVHFRAMRKMVRERTVDTPIPPEVNDFVAPLRTPILGGLAFRAPRSRIAWWAGRGLETRSLALVQALVSDGDVFVDCGANVGVFTVAAASRVGSTGRVYAFEPNPRVRPLLEHNIERHRVADRVVVSPSAVGAASGRFPFTQYENDQVSGFVVAPSQYSPGAVTGSIDVSIEPLDDAVPGRASFLKVDVEGYEREVFHGARQLLARSPDALLLFEMNPGTLRNAGSEPSELLECFPVAHWALWLVDEHADDEAQAVRPIDGDTRAFTSSKGDTWYANVLAVPRHRQREIAQLIHSVSATVRE